jgi:predicted dehydrogenase
MNQTNAPAANDPTPSTGAPITRRGFVLTSAAAAVGVAGGVLPAVARVGVHLGRSSLKVGVVGCGGRGTGAAANILEAAPETQIWAMADVFAERIASSKSQLAALDPEQATRAEVPAERCFTGFDGYRQLLDLKDIDIVILATPPGFRPAQFEAAVRAGKHVFVEKPVGVDPAGIRRVLAACDEADRRGLSIVAGTQRRHENCYLEAMKRLGAGFIGKITSARVYWNQGGLWMNPRQPEWSDLEWQLRNWLYFTWLSGDHIVEQHVHNLDVANWVLGATPAWCWAMGGRQVRTSPAFGHVFDHFAVEYVYPDGQTVQSYCRQIDGCDGRVEEVFVGTAGTCVLGSGRGEIVGERSWKFGGKNNNPYVQEHVDLVRSIREGKPTNEGRAVAHSTLTAIMGRMAAYTGKKVTWEQALNSALDLSRPVDGFGPMPVDAVATPGQTPLI